MTSTVETAQEWINFFTRNKTQLMGFALIIVGCYRIAVGDMTFQSFTGEVWQLFLGGGLMGIERDAKKTAEAVNVAKQEVAMVATEVQTVKEKI